MHYCCCFRYNDDGERESCSQIGLRPTLNKLIHRNISSTNKYYKEDEIESCGKETGRATLGGNLFFFSVVSSFYLNSD